MKFPRKVIRAYWQGMPSAYETDTEDEEAAERHIKFILRALSKDHEVEGSGQTPTLFDA